MKKQNNTLIAGLGLKAFTVWALCVLFSACTIYKEGAVINRAAVQEIRSNSPANESEIREISYNSHANEYGHKELQINGQLFTKSVVNGNTQIIPCAGCKVKLTMPSDSSVKVNMTTEKDGFFSFQGQATTYSVFINNSGFNQMEIGNISFETGGITTFKFINAAGNGVDRFKVVKTGSEYTWSRMQ